MPVSPGIYLLTLQAPLAVSNSAVTLPCQEGMLSGILRPSNQNVALLPQRSEWVRGQSKVRCVPTVFPLLYGRERQVHSPVWKTEGPHLPSFYHPCGSQGKALEPNVKSRIWGYMAWLESYLYVL